MRWGTYLSPQQAPLMPLSLNEATTPIVKCVCMCMCVCVVWVSVAGFLSLLGWEMTRVTHLSSCHTVGVSPQRPRCRVSDLFLWLHKNTALASVSIDDIHRTLLLPPHTLTLVHCVKVCDLLGQWWEKLFHFIQFALWVKIF